VAVYRESRTIVEEPGAVEDTMIVERAPAAGTRRLVGDAGAIDESVVVEVAPTRRVVAHRVIDEPVVAERPIIGPDRVRYDATPHDVVRYGLIVIVTIFVLYLLGRLF
jgi:hypothetical protein